MSKTLQVIEPFFVLEVGDHLELSKDGKYYTSEYNEEFGKIDCNDNDIKSTYTSKFTISAEYAKELIEQGYLAPETEETTKFVNIFEEIDRMLAGYKAEMENLDKEFEGKPACLKVEKTTVLSNMIKLLTHLKSLKK